MASVAPTASSSGRPAPRLTTGPTPRRAGPPARRSRTRARPARVRPRPSRWRRPSSSSSAASARATAAGSSGGSTTSPVSPSATASAAPPLSPATCGTPHAAASRNTMPKPSCSRPPHRLRHSMANTSAHAVEGGQVGLGDPARGAAPGRRGERPAGRAGPGRGPSPPMATTRSGWSGARRAAASISTSMPLRGTRRLTLTTTRASPGRSNRARALARASASSGTKRSTSTPGGTTVTGQGPARRPARPRPPGSRRPR